MNSQYPNAPLLHKFEKPYGNPQCDTARDEIQDLLTVLAKLPTKYILANNRQPEFVQVLQQVVQSANKHLELLGVDVSPQSAKDEGKSNAFSSVSQSLRWYQSVGGDTIK